MIRRPPRSTLFPYTTLSQSTKKRAGPPKTARLDGDTETVVLRKPECDQLTRERRAAHGEHHVLLAVVEVRHRRAALRRRHVHRTDFTAARLVVRAQHRAALAVGRREEAAFAGDDERLRHQYADAPLSAGAWNREPLERRMILDVVRRLAVRDLPRERPLVHVERGDASVRRLDDRQPLHVRSAAAAFTTAAAASAAF